MKRFLDYNKKLKERTKELRRKFLERIREELRYERKKRGKREETLEVLSCRSIVRPSRNCTSSYECYTPVID